jgi:NADPH2:quinone reductase
LRAVQCHDYGDPSKLTIEDIAEPSPGAGEVIVQVEAIGLGYVDALRVRGCYQVKDPLPFIPGSPTAESFLLSSRHCSGLSIFDRKSRQI